MTFTELLIPVALAQWKSFVILTVPNRSAQNPAVYPILRSWNVIGSPSFVLPFWKAELTIPVHRGGDQSS